MSAMLNEEYLSVSEAATLLEVSESTIWRWIDKGDLPAYRVGQRRIRLKKGDVSGLIAPVLRGQETGTQMARTEQQKLGPLTKKEQQQGLAAVEAAKKMLAEMLARRGGEPFSPSYIILDELRDQRTQDLQ